MPSRAPHICGCGRIVPNGQRCACQALRNREADRRRPSARARGYTAEWQRESKAFLINNPACFRCGQPATLVHHATPHRGDEAIFWNRKNWRPACKRCHDGPLQSAEKRGSQW